MLTRTAVVESLTERITKDVGEAMRHVDAHEIVGILEMIKVSVTQQVLALTSKLLADKIVGEAVVN